MRLAMIDRRAVVDVLAVARHVEAVEHALGAGAVEQRDDVVPRGARTERDERARRPRVATDVNAPWPRWIAPSPSSCSFT